MDGPATPSDREGLSPGNLQGEPQLLTNSSDSVRLGGSRSGVRDGGPDEPRSLVRMHQVWAAHLPAAPWPGARTCCCWWLACMHAGQQPVGQQLSRCCMQVLGGSSHSLAASSSNALNALAAGREAFDPWKVRPQC